MVWIRSARGCVTRHVVQKCVVPSPSLHHVWGASCMLPNPLKFHHPYPLLCWPLTPSCARITRKDAGSGALTTSALNAGSRPTCGVEKPIERRATKARCTKPLKPPEVHGKYLQESVGVSSVLGNSPAFPGNVDPVRPATAARNADAGELEPSCVDAHERGGAPPVACTASALSEATAGVEPASKDETTSTAEPEGLVPRTQNKAECRLESQDISTRGWAVSTNLRHCC